MKEENVSEKKQDGLSRRAFLGGSMIVAGAAATMGLAGCATKEPASSTAATETAAAEVSGSMQTTDPSKAVWPVIEEFEIMAAGDGEIAFIAEPIAESEIIATHDVDVVVCGLGPAGYAAALSCAENGLKTVAVEKQTKGNYNSPTIGGTDSKLHKHWGMTYDKDLWISDAMIDCAFQGSMELYRHWLDFNGEAVDWYIDHFDNKDLKALAESLTPGSSALMLVVDDTQFGRARQMLEEQKATVIANALNPEVAEDLNNE
ncbi:MAG: FAD-binding protein, partial [Actinobacteria bacterium]|nr:FAD-binding protein [Actinomycetota bacterium]